MTPNMWPCYLTPISENARILLTFYYDVMILEMAYSVEIINTQTGKRMCTLERLPSKATISDVKEKLASQYSVYYRDRQRNGGKHG